MSVVVGRVCLNVLCEGMAGTKVCEVSFVTGGAGYVSLNSSMQQQLTLKPVRQSDGMRKKVKERKNSKRSDVFDFLRSLSVKYKVTRALP